MKTEGVFPILSLPDLPLRIILGHLTYAQVSEMRIISKDFDRICRMHLDSGFRSAYNSAKKSAITKVSTVNPRFAMAIFSSLITTSCRIEPAIGKTVSCFFAGKLVDKIIECSTTDHEDLDLQIEQMKELKFLSQKVIAFVTNQIIEE